MNKNKITIISCIAVAILIAGATLILITINKEDSNLINKSQDKELSPTSRAESLEQEAINLTDEKPNQAIEKFNQAEQAYIEAGNDKKASEMSFGAAATKANQDTESSNPPKEDSASSGVQP